MSLVIENGDGLKNAESYVSAAECLAYHQSRGNDPWTGETGNEEAVLREATAYIDDRYRNRFKGVRRTEDQALAWPRHGAVDQDGYTVDCDKIPKLLKDAVCETALRMLASDLTPDLERGGQIQSESVAGITTIYANGAPGGTIYPEIERKLYGLLENSMGIKLMRV